MAKKAVLITGGNSGIGYECALELARQDCQVFIASRNQEASKKAVETIIQQTGNKAVSALELDLGSFKFVRGFAKEIIKKNIIFNTA